MPGSRVRENIEEYIDGLQQPDLEDFKIACEELESDGPRTYLMRSQVLSVHLVSGLAKGENEKIMEYCEEQSGRVLEEMKAIEEEIRVGLEGEQGRVEKGETIFVVNKSVDDKTLAAAVSKMTVAKREKVCLGFRNLEGKKPEEKEAEEAKPVQTVSATDVAKASYADALKH